VFHRFCNSCRSIEQSEMKANDELDDLSSTIRMKMRVKRIVYVLPLLL
jgi:hypothetical protein